MDAVAHGGRNPLSKHHLNVENEQADAGRDGRTRLARPNSQGERGQGKVYFPCSADHDQDGNHTRLIHTQLKVLTVCNELEL